jgi:hypothetical protein
MRDTIKVSGAQSEIKASVMPFDTSLWSYVHKSAAAHAGHISSKTGGSLLKNTYKHHKGLEAREAEAAPTKMLARHIKKLSLNPSVYGNVYSSLGTS